MTTMPKTSGASDTRHGSDAFALSGDRGRALANARGNVVHRGYRMPARNVWLRVHASRKDGETARETMGCKNPTDVAAIESRWVEETLRDYNTEMTKLMTICTSRQGGSSPKG